MLAMQMKIPVYSLLSYPAHNGAPGFRPDWGLPKLGSPLTLLRPVKDDNGDRNQCYYLQTILSIPMEAKSFFADDPQTRSATVAVVNLGNCCCSSSGPRPLSTAWLTPRQRLLGLYRMKLVPIGRLYWPSR